MSNQIAAIETDVLDMFEESESLICLLPRYAKVRRFVSPIGRAYAVLGGEYQTPQFNFGLTTWLSMSDDCRDEDLIQYFNQKYGLDAPRMLREKADFGTLGHELTGTLFTQKYIDTGTSFSKRIRIFMEEKGLPMYKFDQFVDTQAAYMFSMSCFAHERNFNCFAIEMPTTDFDKGITTCIDAIGEMDDIDAKGNVLGRINVTINFKFRDNPACYSKDIAQTNIEKFMLEDLIEAGFTKMPFKNQNVNKSFILCPKKVTTRTRDNYLLVDTTGKYSREDYDFAHIVRQKSKEKPLEVKLDNFYPKYRHTRLIVGQKPEFESLRQRLENMFLD